MIVAGLQLDTVWEDPPASFARAELLAEAAVARGARLLALPEMFATGFSMEAAQVAAHADATRGFLADLAQRHGVFVLGGYATERPDSADPRPVNRANIFDPSGGEVLRYDKIHPFSYAGEDRHYAGGEEVATTRLDDLRVTVLICYDLRFPEPFRAAAAGTDLFVVIANWPAARRGHWSTLLTARAIEEQCYVLGVNRVGDGDGLHYTGDSALLDPLGERIDGLSEAAGVVAGEVQPDRVRQLRARFTFLADRRPEVYSGLARPGPGEPA
jgi:predicted amidohydrolase